MLMKFCSEDTEIEFVGCAKGEMQVIYSSRSTGKRFCRHKMKNSDAESEQNLLMHDKDYTVVQ